ncbi:DUF2626 family protein [Risungbinella massiliensis]|uniref:DUF2626 family protein n=1 Tax=Risungbinella massiliensis TaxID=1329796 RepID=UPI0005CBEC92|nr:DUF2626 family protein [Risungbinella massiliensis]
MSKMFHVLGFWALVIALMFLAGHLTIPAILFLVQAALFFLFGGLRLTERTYMYLFGAYMFVSFCGMVFYSSFMM